MHISSDALFAPELVSCVSAGGDPSVTELFSVARRVWLEGAADRSAFAWGRLSPADPERVCALRVAHAAMAGSLDY